MRALFAILTAAPGCRAAQPASPVAEATALRLAPTRAGYDQSTPRAALRSFVRALSERRHDVALRFIPASEREGITPENLELIFSGEGLEDLLRILGSLQEHLEDPIEIASDHATMPYGGERSVSFVREGRAWKIEAPE